MNDENVNELCADVDVEDTSMHLEHAIKELSLGAVYQEASSSGQEVVEVKGVEKYGSVGNKVDEKGLVASEIDKSCKQKQMCKDLKLWPVQVERGDENKTSLELMQKFIARQKKKNPLKIQSVVAREGVGCIYIEAYKRKHAKQAISGMRLIAPEKVPVQDVAAVFSDVPLPFARTQNSLLEAFEIAYRSPQHSGSITPTYDPLWSEVLAEWESTSEVFDVDVWDPTLDSPPSSPDSLDVAMAGDPLEPSVPVPEYE